MPDNSDIHHRRSIRLQHYDYVSPGGYFVTICSYERQCMFGEISDSGMQLNELGKIVQDEWTRTPTVRSNVALDEYVIMPNHIHGIILIHAADENRKGRAHDGAPVQPVRRKSGSLGSIIAGFKSAATKRINESRKTPGTPVWHRNYYEHVIRSEKDLELIREYIVNNPRKWDEDENNPVAADCVRPICDCAEGGGARQCART